MSDEKDAGAEASLEEEEADSDDSQEKATNTEESSEDDKDEPSPKQTQEGKTEGNEGRLIKRLIKRP